MEIKTYLEIIKELEEFKCENNKLDYSIDDIIEYIKALQLKDVVIMNKVEYKGKKFLMPIILFITITAFVAAGSFIESLIVYLIAIALGLAISFKWIFFILFIMNLFFCKRNAIRD